MNYIENTICVVFMRWLHYTIKQPNVTVLVSEYKAEEYTFHSLMNKGTTFSVIPLSGLIKDVVVENYLAIIAPDE